MLSSPQWNQSVPHNFNSNFLLNISTGRAFKNDIAMILLLRVEQKCNEQQEKWIIEWILKDEKQ